ncbi:hypothetical protein [Gudongella oleilytica]|jgi:hypothetical protein|uniref:hypothetical protein n=1 Tax=Gudongella oleilytica TaxID=1582259 RepID=UPI002A358649|nr:hypothetical protein [Gudongella oleilytica]MDY0257292.1 hypothetical protein [Gudongella oleilytica]
MSVLDNVLAEEYERMQRIRQAMQKELEELPQGYISKKKIKGNVYFYLQWRSGSKVLSKYVHPENLVEIEQKIKRRKELLKSINEIDKSLVKIKKVVK